MMSSKNVATLVLTIIAIFFGYEDAVAFPLPCVGDRIVKVIDIPADRQTWGPSVDIGYKWPGCFGSGEWIGFLGTTDKFVKLDEEKWQALLAMANLQTTPAEPQRWQYLGRAYWTELFYLTIILLAAIEQFRSQRRWRRDRNTRKIGLDEAEQLNAGRLPKGDK